MAQGGGAAGWDGAERRRDPRIAIHLAAELRVAGRTWIGRVRDLSRGGAYFEVEGVYRDLPWPTERGALFAPGLGARSCPVEVRNHRAVAGAIGGLGLRFGTLDPAVGSRLQARLREAGL